MRRTCPRFWIHALAAAAAALAAPTQAQTIPRVKLTDGELACSQVHGEIGTMDMVINNIPASAGQARARKDFLTQLFVAKGCKVSDLSFAGQPVPPETFRQLMSGGSAIPPVALSAGPAMVAPGPATGAAPAAPAVMAPPPAAPRASIADITAALDKPVTLLAGDGLVKGSASVKGKRYYISEYRVMFEVNGSVTASTRAAYFGGTNYGATRMTVQYQVPQLDIAVLQAITDKAYADFLARLEAAGIKPEPAEVITREFGTVYEASVEGSKPGAPVFDEIDYGHTKRRYLLMAPTGMKLNPHGFAGLGAGNIGNRMTYVKANVEGVSVGMAVNLAAQETSGSGSSLFRSGSSANASAAMEIAGAKAVGAFQGHVNAGVIFFNKPLPVPGQFATMREMGGYDTRQDSAVQGIQALGRMAGVAANQSKRVDLAVDVDHAAMAGLALQGLATANQSIASSVK